MSSLNKFLAKTIATALNRSFPSATFTNRHEAALLAVDSFAEAHERVPCDDDTGLIVSFVQDSPDLFPTL